MSGLWIPVISDQPKTLADLSHDLIAPPRTPPSVHKDGQKLDGEAMLHRIKSAKMLTGPYQRQPQANSELFLYIWTLPPLRVVEELAGIGENCFQYTDMNIGLLFSKPISKADYVCRVPVYLTRGLARARVRFAGKVRIPTNQFTLVQGAHTVLSELLWELIHRQLYSVTDPVAVVQKDDFSTSLSFLPEESSICSLVTLVRKMDNNSNNTTNSIYFDACSDLIQWSRAKHDHVGGGESLSSTEVTLPHGILTTFPCKLDQVVEGKRRGLLVKPTCTAAYDSGLFAVHTTTTSKPGTIDGYRLTRHGNAGRVQSGRCPPESTGCRGKLSSIAAKLCMVHPLPTWLCFQLSILPVICYQMNRALSSLELYEKLQALLVSSLPPTSLDRSRVTVLVPDRLDAPSAMLRQLHQATTVDKQANCNQADVSSDKTATVRVPELQGHLPQPSELIQAITTLGASDVVNLERLEFLGDSLLQLIVSLLVYTKYPEEANEDNLTRERMRLVRNTHLYDVALKNGWHEYLTNSPYSPMDHFLPPCYTLSNCLLLKRALLHHSTLSPSPADSYERLEFLGDAVLGYVITAHLFRKYRDYDPGQLTQHRSLLVNNATLAYALFAIKLYPFIVHNIPDFQETVKQLKNIHSTRLKSFSAIESVTRPAMKGRPMKVLADVFESLVGAVFVDTFGNLDTPYRWNRNFREAALKLNNR